MLFNRYTWTNVSFNDLIDKLITLFDDPKVEMASVASTDLHKHDFTNDNVVKVNLDNENNAISFVRNNIDPEQIYYRHIGIYAYTVKDLYLYCELPKSKSEINLSLEQFRFLDNGINIMAYCASSNPGASIDSVDNLNEIKGINNWIKTKNLY